MPDDLKALVQAAADESGRSLHAELLYRIQKSFEADSSDQTSEMLYEMRRTQLLLELNTIKAELGALFARGEGYRRALRGEATAEEAATAEADMEQIKRERKDLDAKSSAVLQRLFELDKSSAKRTK